MTILSTAQDAAKEMGLSAPSSLLASTDRFAVELGALAKECAVYIARNYDWRLFTTLATLTGDAATTAFSLPSDYDRMPVKAAVWRSSTTRPMQPILDLDQWRINRLQNFANPAGEWMILTGSLQVFPVMSASETGTFYYQSNKIVKDSGDVPKASFTADTDVFRLPERLLKLCLKWHWRAMKKLDSSDEQEDYQIAEAHEIKNDKGSRILYVGRARTQDGARMAYPGIISA